MTPWLECAICYGKSLIIENPSIARRAIDLLSDLLRSSLYEKEHMAISIAEELALVKDYVELEQK